MLELFTTSAASILLMLGEKRALTEVLITSSVLILALLVLRGAFRRSLSRRMQYALWALVLLRLLVPFQLPAARFSVLTSVQPVRTAVGQRLEQELDQTPVRPPNAPTIVPGQLPGGVEQLPVEPSGGMEEIPAASGNLVAFSGWDILRWSGSGVMTLFFLAANLGFWLRLRFRRKAYPVEGCTRRVYLVEEGLVSPCLFGPFRPAVYLTPEAVSTPERLRHVLAHEETHARHWDPLWALLRCVCLAAYWFDPLVWVAAAVSKTDSELACDEGALARLGEDERIPYGQTLLHLVPVRRGPGNPLLTATTMTAGKRQLKDRITRIAQKPRQVAAAAVAAVILAGIISACTFTGGAAGTPAPAVTPGQADAIVAVWGEPEKVLSLANAAPYTPEPFVVEDITDWMGQAEVYSASSDFGLEEPFDICLLTSAQEDMQHFAVVDKRLEHLVYRSFLALPMDWETDIGFRGGGGFPEGLFGHKGPVNAITYQTEDGVMRTDYVCVGEDGMPIRLVQAVSGMSETFHVDCDGDGNAEIVAPNQLFFQRGDTVYEANIPALWAEAYPEHILDWNQWDAGTGMLTASGHVQGADGVTRTWTRYLRYDGENLLVYRDPRTMEDHVMSGIRVPDGVLDKAKELVQDWMSQGGEAGELDTAEYDDWRIENMTGPTEHKVGGITVHVYRFNYEYHTTTPAEVVLAGGRYITEDNWVMPGYPNSDCLFFQVEDDGSLTYLWHESSTAGLDGLIEAGLHRLNRLDKDAVYLVQGLWDALCGMEELTLDLKTVDGIGGGTYSTDISWGYNQPRDITTDFHWETLETVPPAELEDTDILRVSGGGNSLTFYQKPRLVEYQRDGDRRWFRAEQTVTDDVFASELFAHIRQWYDEIEADALEMGIVIPDDGRSYEDLAQAWVEQYEGTHLLATSGSKHRWTYLDVVSVEVVEEYPSENYPEEIRDQEAFRFHYSVVFVPETQAALNWSMAGNTANYEGEDAPEGAFQWWRVAYLYLSEDGWRCDGTGTG